MSKRVSKGALIVLFVWVIPLALFGLAFLVFPKHRTEILALEIVSPLPPLP